MGEARYDKIFAIRVNLFIQPPAVQLAKIRALLAPEGILYLFNDPPVATQTKPFVETARRGLAAHGFTVTEVIEQASGTVKGVCLVAEARA